MTRRPSTRGHKTPSQSFFQIVINVIIRKVHLYLCLSFRSVVVFSPQAHELGTPVSASFEGFGADESGRVSAQQLHQALKEIGQFRWTTVGVD